MKSKLYFAFALGAVSGALCTWYYVKDKYEKIAQEEIDSVKEVFKTHNLVPIKDEERQKRQIRHMKSRVSCSIQICWRETVTRIIQHIQSQRIRLRKKWRRSLVRIFHT